MQTSLINRKLSLWLGLLLTLPTAIFIMASVFKYETGWPLLYDAIAPTLENWGIRESPGWNINLLILFGPVLALILNFFAVVIINGLADKDQWQLNFCIKKYRANIIISITALLVLTVLFVYLIGEHCCNGIN